MHEMHMVKNLFEDLLKLAAENKAKKITDVYIKIGDFTELNRDIITFYFKENGKGTVAEGAKIHFEDSNMRELTLLSFDCE